MKKKIGGKDHSRLYRSETREHRVPLFRIEDPTLGMSVQEGNM